MTPNFDFVTGIMIIEKYDLEIYTNWYHKFICIERIEKDDTGEVISVPHLFYDIISILDFIINWYNSKVVTGNIEKNRIVTWFNNCDEPWIARIEHNIARKLLIDLKAYNKYNKAHGYKYFKLHNKIYGYRYKIESDHNGDTYIDIYNGNKTYRISFGFDKEDKVYIIYSITLIEDDNNKV